MNFMRAVIAENNKARLAIVASAKYAVSPVININVRTARIEAAVIDIHVVQVSASPFNCRIANLKVDSVDVKAVDNAL
ncbi:hypothetical protein D3C85_1166530 [compost metagenome]